MLKQFDGIIHCAAKVGGIGGNMNFKGEFFYDNMISFPFHIWMSNKEVNYLINSIKKSLTILRKKVV